MRRCGCSGTCSCLVVAGEGIVVQGIGSIENPYEISSDAADLAGRIEFTDTSTVDFTATGVGSGANPLTVSAYARVAMEELTNVVGPADNGQVLVWVDDHWEPQDQSGGGGTGVPPGGTDGQVLTKQSNADGDATWETLPGAGTVETTEYCLLRKSTAQTMATSTEVPITFDAGVSEDPHGMWNGSDLITIAKAGVYLIQAQYSYVAQATPNGNRITILKVNGGTTRQWYHAVTNNILTGTVSIQRDLKAGDVIQLRQYQSTGGNLDTGTPTASAPSLAVVRIGGGGIASERVYASARAHVSATSINSATSTPVPFDTAGYEDGIAWNGVDGFIIPVTGYYQINAILTWAPSNSTGVRGALLTVNNSALQSDVVTPNAGSQVVSVMNAVTAKLNAGDVVRVNGYQTSGAALALSGNSAYNRFSIVKVPETIPASNGIIGERVYAASRTSASGQSITSQTSPVTKINFELADRSDGVAWDATNQGYIIPVTGWYDVALALQFAANATGYRIIYILVNGSTVATVSETGMAASGGQSLSVSRHLYLTAGDLVSGAAVQNSGASLALAASSAYNYLSITKSPSVFPQSVALGERTYAAQRTQGAAFSVPHNTPTKIPWDSQTVSDGIAFDGTGVFTIPVAGYYDISASVIWDSAATTGYRQIRIHINGGAGPSVNAGASPTNVCTEISRVMLLAAGDQIELRAFHNFGSAVNLVASGANNWVSITKVPAPAVAGNAASGVWGTGSLAAPYGPDSLVGSEIYVDSRAQLRARPNWFTGAGSGIANASDPVAEYPLGVSSMYLSPTETFAGSGWPVESGYWFILTQRYGVEAVQIATRLTTGTYGVPGGATEIQIRSGNESSGWQPWVKGMGIDTGWLSMTWSASGWTLPVAPAARRIGRTVFLRGRASNASFAAVAGHTTVATLPATIPPPPQAILFPMACYGTTVYQRSAQIDATGNVQLQTSLANGNYYDFTGSYVIPDTTA